MRKLLNAILTASLFFCATPVMAIPFYYEASDVAGVGTVAYGVGAPVFDFLASSGSVDTNMAGFVAGNYSIDVTLANLWVDVNEDGTNDFTLSDQSLSLGAYYIPAIPLSGSYGALDWAFDPYSSVHLSYDFGDTGLTNEQVNGSLALFDILYGDGANGFMNANIGWESFRIDLTDTAPVPEPGTFILLGAGITGLAFYRRRKNA